MVIQKLFGSNSCTPVETLYPLGNPGRGFINDIRILASSNTMEEGLSIFSAASRKVRIITRANADVGDDDDPDN